MERSLVARMLRGLVQRAIGNPRATLVAALVLIAGCVVLSVTRLGYWTDRSALVSKHSEFQRRWQAYVDEFGDREDVVVVVQGAGGEVIEPVLDALATALGRRPEQFQAVLHEIDLSKIRSKGLHFLSVSELQVIDRFLEESEPILRGGWAWLNPGTMAAGILGRLQTLAADQRAAGTAAAQQKLLQLAESLLVSLEQSGRYQSPWPAMATTGLSLNESPKRHLLIENGRMGFLLLKLAEDPHRGSFVRNAQSLAALRDLLADARRRFPGVEIGLTGLPVMENDEMRSSQGSMSLATGLSLAGVLLVLVAGLGGVRHALLALLALLGGTLAALGYTTLCVGHLNILSSAFGAVLIGLGINYGTYFVARYLQLRHAEQGVDQALLGAAGSVGPGIAIGAGTTAIAFCTAGCTEFNGLAELGIVAGGGIVLCWLAAMTVLPALIHLVDNARRTPGLPTPLHFHRWIEPLLDRPRQVLGLTLAATALACLGLARLPYDHNLLNLQPAGVESVELERKLLGESKESAWFALSMAKTPAEVAARKAEFLKLKSVDRVEDIASNFPSDEADKLPIVRRIQSRLGNLPDRAPSIPVSSPAELGQMLVLAQGFMQNAPQAAAFQDRLERIGNRLGKLPASEYYAQLSAYQQRLAEDLLERLRVLQAVAVAEPPQLADLPPALVSRFVGKNGSHLLKVYSNSDIWNMQALEQFVRDVRRVDPEATGNPLQVYEASMQMKRSYEQASWLAVAVILPFVFLNFRSLGATLLALVPLVLGTLQMFGLMGLLGIARNPANMIALPLMLGMGVDNGVHILHDYLARRGLRYRMSAATGTAVVLNTLTTMVGFAVLILAEHRGLQSLGRVLTIGMGCCLFSSLVILPALLAWISRHGLTVAEVRAALAAATAPPASMPPPTTAETPPAPAASAAAMTDPAQDPHSEDGSLFEEAMAAAAHRRFDRPHVPQPSPHIVPRRAARRSNA